MNKFCVRLLLLCALVIGETDCAIFQASVVNPVISRITPATATAGGSTFTLTVDGTGFQANSNVEWNGSARKTTYVSATRLTAVIQSTDIALPGTANVDAVNPGRGGKTTIPASFQITPAGPTIASLSPASANAGGPAFQLTINGTGFVSTSVADWNGSPRTTTFVDATQLIADITASDLANAGTAQVAVANPADSGGLSAPATFTISSGANPVPSISNVSPSSIGAGSAGFQLTVTGTNFVGSSVLQWNGSPRTTTVNSATSLRAAINTADVATAGSASVTVFDPAPGGGSSNAVTFSITSTQAVGIVNVLSMSDGGTFSNGTNQEIALSMDGRYAAFASPRTTNLVSNPTVSQDDDVYYHDSCVGAANCSMTTLLASAENGTSGVGTDGDGRSHGPSSISADGRFVAFVSDATNLASPQVAHFTQGYIRDTCTGATNCTPSTSMATLTTSGSEPNFPSLDIAISSQGRYVGFVSEANDLVPGVTVGDQAYIRDTCQGPVVPVPGCTPFTALVSADASGNPGNNGASGVDVSANGRFVSFSSRATNLPGAPAGGANEVYVRDTCLNVPVCTPSTTIASVDNAGNPAPTGDFGITSISDDGRVVSIISFDPLAPNHSTGWNLYLRDTCVSESGPVANCTPSTITASVADDGSAANNGLVPDFTSHLVSGSGRLAVFNSLATNLAPGGTPASGIFVRDTCIAAAPGCTPSTVLVSVDSTGNFVAGGEGVISSDGHYFGFEGLPAGASSVQAMLGLTSF